MESPLLSPQVPWNHLCSSLNKLSSPSPFFPCAPAPTILLAPSDIQFVNLCLALRTPKVDVESESHKCWVGSDWHFPGVCPYIQAVTGCLCSQDSLLAHLTFSAQQDPQGLSQSAALQEVGCISSREILSQGQGFARVLTEFHKLPIHPACTCHSGWQPSPRANWQLTCLPSLVSTVGSCRCK